jgi:ribonuclease HI
MSDAVMIHTDGAARGNPGAAAIAYIIEGLPDGPIEFAQTIGKATNNQAEYQALLEALKKLATLQPTSLMVKCLADSELMVKQLNGEYRVKNAELRPHFAAIQQLVSSLKQGGNTIIFSAVRRIHNQRADQLCNQALDNQR